jgi:hypothetical protein
MAFTVQINPANGFSAAINLSASIPSGFACVEPACGTTMNQGTPSFTFHLSAANALPGTYPLTFTAVSGSLRHTATANITINPPVTPDFNFSVTPASASLLAGTQTPSYSFTITPINGFAAPINITAAASTGITCLQTPCSVTTSASITNALQFSTGATLSSGTYTLTFTATSGSITHIATATLIVTAPPTPDFTFAVTPTYSSLTAGAQTPTYGFTIAPINGFAAAINITAAAPTGFTCLQTPCSVTTSASIANALQFSTGAGMTSGSYTLTFTATSGTLTHTAATTIFITIPTAPILSACGGTALPTTVATPGPTSYIFTGDPPPVFTSWTRKASAYDSLHNVIFVANNQLGEVDVISPNTLSIVARIPVSQPEGIDLTADYSTLIVGTDTQFFYRIDTSSLCVIDRPRINGFSANLSAMFPLSLADGSIFFNLADIETGDAAIVRWTIASGAATFGSSVSEIGSIVRSGDHQHLYFSGTSYSGSGPQPVLGRYDVGTGQITSYPDSPGYEPVGANLDGSRIYTQNGQFLSVTDASFNILGSSPLTYAQAPGYVFSPRDSRGYVGLGYSPYIAVLDGSTLATLGYLPLQYEDYAGNFTTIGSGTYDTIDGTGRIISPAPLGLYLLAVDGPLQTTPGLATIGAGAPEPNNILYANSFSIGYAVDGGNKTEAAAVSPTSASFTEGLTTLPATISLGSSSQINITVPAFVGGCADMAIDFNIGPAVFYPRAFCYGPTVDALDGDSGPSVGGATLTLYGKGFGNKPVITVGGTVATVTSNPSGFSYAAISPETLRVTVPPGTPGSAAITISNGSGPAATLPWTYTYYTRQDASLPAGTSPFQIVYDAPRGRLLWTDSGRNLLVVSSSTTGQTLQEIAVGPRPWGLSLSPDGSKLAIASSGDNMVTIYDAASFSKLQSSSVPSIAYGDTLSPLYLGMMSNGKVLVSAVTGNALSGGYDTPHLLTYDLPSNSMTAVSSSLYLYCNNIADVLTTSDGTIARVGNTLYSVTTGTLSPLPSTYSDCTQIGLSADGAVDADTAWISDGAGTRQNFYNIPSQIAAKQNSLLSYTTDGEYDAVLSVNASGSLAVAEFASTLTSGSTQSADRIRFFDTNHGSLVRTAMVPGGLTDSYYSKPLALDPEGQRFWAFTSAGLTTFQFVSDPLAIGEVQTTNGTLTLLGSGFTSSMTISIDGQPLSSPNVTGTTRAAVALPSLSTGTHSVTMTNSGQSPYVLPAAFTSP